MSAQAPTVLLEHHLKQLKLPTMLREYKTLARVCTQERADYPTYLLRLTERELIDRERRSTERRIKAAKFPVLKTLETFDFSAQPSINQPLIRDNRRRSTTSTGVPAFSTPTVSRALCWGRGQMSGSPNGPSSSDSPRPRRNSRPASAAWAVN